MDKRNNQPGGSNPDNFSKKTEKITNINNLYSQASTVISSEGNLESRFKFPVPSQSQAKINFENKNISNNPSVKKTPHKTPSKLPGIAEDGPIDIPDEDFWGLINESNFDENMDINMCPDNSLYHNQNLNLNIPQNHRNIIYPEKIKEYYKVVEVSEINQREKRISCEPTQLKDESEENFTLIYKIRLLGLWAEVIVDPQDFVFISATYDKTDNCYIIADESVRKTFKNYNPNQYTKDLEIIDEFIIVEPETLLSPSRIKSAFPCIRKSLFIEQFKILPTQKDGSNKELIIGSVIHEVFQSAIKKFSQNFNQYNENSGKKFILECIAKVLKNYLLDMAIYDLDHEEIEKTTKTYVDKIFDFFKNFFHKKVYINGLRVENFTGCEKVYQSQVLGMKGVIDMLIETQNESRQFEITPLELKTGFSQSNSDIMQVLIYCLILSEQMAKNSYNGVLVYIKKDIQNRIKVNKNDIVNVIVIRNNIAKLMKQVGNDARNYQILPDLYKKYDCGKCYQRDICHFHYVNHEKVNRNFMQQNLHLTSNNISQQNINEINSNSTSNENSNSNLPVDQLIDEIILNSNAKDGFDEERRKSLSNYIADPMTQLYFEHFYKIINDEETFAYTKEKSLVKDSEVSDLSEFKKYKIESLVDKGNSFDVTVYSEDDGILNLMNQLSGSEDDIVSQFTFLNDGYHIYEEINKKSFYGVLVNKSDNLESSKFTLNIVKSYISKYKATSNAFWKDRRFEYLYLKNINTTSKYPFKLMRGNLITTCLNFKPRLKELVVNLGQVNIDANMKSEVAQFLFHHYQNEFKSLNYNQKGAVFKALTCQDYALIIGYPGSGKTTIIAFLIDVLVKMGKKILISAHTNTAVDNILLKLKERKVNFVRISNNENSVNHGVREYIFQNKTCETFSEWKEYINKTQVYGATCLGVYNKVLANLEFDYCILDEACQIFEPTLLGPLLLTKKFILVGDPYQLPALLRSLEQAPNSMFERLFNRNQSVGIELNLQYRMNEEILKLSNKCVYNFSIQCGNPEVATRRLDVKLEEIIYNYPQWVCDILNPDRPVIFADYYNYIIKTHPEFLINTQDSNNVECSIVKQLLLALKQLNFDLNKIGVITPYKSQELLLLEKMREHDFFNIFTIDKSQGIEKEIIILSFVKTNIRTKLLKDIARINVAFTRPRSKLIIIGLMNYLEGIDKLKDYMNLIKTENWVYNFEEDAYIEL
jgi:DNA replication ATP-dependent helicase Dna2